MADPIAQSAEPMHDPFGRSRLPASLVDANTSHAERFEDLREAVWLLRAMNSDAARRVADGLVDWLVTGGDLQSRLGLRPGAGGRWSGGSVAARLKARNELLAALASSTKAPSRSAAAAAIATALAASPALRERVEGFGVGVPLSARQVCRVLAQAGHQIGG